MAAEPSTAGGVGGEEDEEVGVRVRVLPDVDQILQFLRRNGLGEVESALKRDIIEKNELGSADFEKFLFELPPVRVPAGLWPSAVGGESGDDGGRSNSGFSSDDEFVSVGSTTSGVCSSEFTNPYGLRSGSQPNSDTSSERMSQFGTARDYPDFDMQNDLLWYDHEKDEGRFVAPSFEDPGCLGGTTSEDKFVMSSGTADPVEDNTVGLYDKSEGFDTEASVDFLDKPCLLDKDPANFVYLSSKEARDSISECHMALVHTTDAYDCIKEDSKIEDRKGNCQLVPFGADYDELERDELSEAPNELPAAATEGEDTVNDELFMYENQDDEYEVFDLRIIHRKNRTGFEENKEFQIVLNVVIGGRYYVTEYLGSAAFSKVVQAQDLYTGMDVCLKIIKNDKDFFDQSLDEIKLLKLANKHDPNDERHVLRLYDYFYHQEHLFIVCELLRANLYEFQKFNQESGAEPYFTLSRLQVITRQCLEALEYLHGLGIIHCDLKPENILIKSYRRCEIKVIDLGSSCFKTDNLCLYVQSRSYRAPEVMLGLPYDEKIDMWSLGCILAELCSGEVLFPNDSVATILGRIVGVLGDIDIEMLENGQDTDKYFTKERDLYFIDEETEQIEYIIPEETSLDIKVGTSDEAFLDFARSLLEINPAQRLTASQALRHPWLSHSYD